MPCRAVAAAVARGRAWGPRVYAIVAVVMAATVAGPVAAEAAVAFKHGRPVLFEHGEEALAGRHVALQRAGGDHVNRAVAAILAPQDPAGAWNTNQCRYDVSKALALPKAKGKASPNGGWGKPRAHALRRRAGEG